MAAPGHPAVAALRRATPSSAPSLLEFGNDEQQALAPAAIRGDTVWCIGMSEPNAGSDLADLSTRAVLDGDTFVVNGQKVWTSATRWSPTKCFCYVRTDPDVPKHKGISAADHRHGHARHRDPAAAPHHRARPSSPRCSSPTSMVPADEPRRRAQRRLAHHDGLARPRARRAVGRGRGRGPARRRRPRRRWPSDRGSTATRSCAAGSPSCYAAGRGRCGRSATRASPPSPRARRRPSTRYMKLATSELRQGALRAGHGAPGRRSGGASTPTCGRRGRPVAALVLHRRFAGTIGGGTSEIQRNIIATRVLGLPRG